MKRSAVALLGAVLVTTVVTALLTALPAAAVGVPLAFSPVAPVRVLDTRETGSTLGPGSVITLDLTAGSPATPPPPCST